MSLSRVLLDLTARLLELSAGAAPGPAQGGLRRRILVIRRGRMGDMICTLPLLRSIRRHDASIPITVACDEPGFPIAQTFAAVDEVILLDPARNSWLALLKNARRLQGYDCVIAAKGGFDRRLAMLTRLTNAPRRIGFENRIGAPSSYYTDAVEIPAQPGGEHQVETLQRLLGPLGAPPVEDVAPLRLPKSARDFAARVLGEIPFAGQRGYLLVNLSSTAPLKFGDDAFAAVLRLLVAETDFVVGLVSAPRDRTRTHQLAAQFDAKRVAAIDTPGSLDLAALLERAAFLLTPEGGAAHLAAAMGRPAVVLWSEGPFEKWHSRGPDHTFVRAAPGSDAIAVEHVWQALQPFLSSSTPRGPKFA